jgi:hypothetical protein
VLVLPLTGRDEKILDVRFWHKADIGPKFDADQSAADHAAGLIYP